MKYRKFGNLDRKVSALGFGCMRFPVVGEDPGVIDEPEAARMLRYAIDHGVNYLDTAYPYHRGNSERFLGRFLKEGYREKVNLATKLPTWLIKAAEDFDRYLDEQLEKLQTDYIDFYLLHGLNGRNWASIRDMGVLKWAEGAIADGRIGCLGFSFHDTYEVFEEIVDAYDGWALCQIQYNYLDEDIQAGTRGLHYAASKGLAVVVMEPIRGGQLANLPKPVTDIFNRGAKKRTPADWALQWVWNHPEVSVVLSGMSTMEQVIENVASAGESGPGTLSEGDLSAIAQARDKYRGLFLIPCTECRYCMPCPNGVWIPHNLSRYNLGAIPGQLELARTKYSGLDESARASACIQCRECEDLCPQHILISEWMPRVHAVLGEGQTYPCLE